jgi:hypothetical protein
MFSERKMFAARAHARGDAHARSGPMRSLLAWLGHTQAGEGARGLQGIALRSAALSSLLVACTAPQTLVTARHTPCKPREIQISELTYSGSTEDWLASCRDLHFRCQTREQGRRLLYSCKPVKTPRLPADAGPLQLQDGGASDAETYAPVPIETQHLPTDAGPLEAQDGAAKDADADTPG